MNSLREEYIQEMFEKGTPIQDTTLSEAERECYDSYKILFSALGDELPEKLSPGFSDRMVRLIELEKAPKKSYSFHFSIIAILVLAITVLIISTKLIDMKYSTSILPSIFRQKWIALFSFLVVYVIQYLDKKLVKEKIQFG